MRYCVFPGNTSTGLQTWVVCVLIGGRPHMLRHCSERVDAEYICSLLHAGMIQPQDAVNYMVPSWEEVGEPVETVGQLHRRLRR